MSLPQRFGLAVRCRPAPSQSSPCPHISSLTLQLRSFSITSQLSAHHKSEGRANGPKDGAGKRLGCKKTGGAHSSSLCHKANETGQLVVPGNIIFRQRGTKWFPGENCGMGRDHTIFALAKGFVRYYRDPFEHPKRKYIGVALQKEDELPTPPTEPRRRRLGMDAVPLSVPDPIDVKEDEGGVKPRRARNGRLLTMGKSYAFSITNWDIGRVAEREGVTERVKPFDHKDRWLAWKKRVMRRKAIAERIALMGASKKQKKGKGKK